VQTTAAVAFESSDESRSRAGRSSSINSE
jgi:hypothetical protein